MLGLNSLSRHWSRYLYFIGSDSSGTLGETVGARSNLAAASALIGLQKLIFRCVHVQVLICQLFNLTLNILLGLHIIMFFVEIQ